MTQTQMYVVAALAIGILLGRKSAAGIDTTAGQANIAKAAPEWWSYAGSWQS